MFFIVLQFKHFKCLWLWFLLSFVYFCTDICAIFDYFVFIVYCKNVFLCGIFFFNMMLLCRMMWAGTFSLNIAV
jgi:hypothetical protein